MEIYSKELVIKERDELLEEYSSYEDKENVSFEMFLVIRILETQEQYDNLFLSL